MTWNMLKNEHRCIHTIAGAWRLGSTGLIVFSITSALRTLSIPDIKDLPSFQVLSRFEYNGFPNVNHRPGSFELEVCC